MSSNDDDRDYEVGYGKPPKSTRFKKGQSGNPNGRPKGAKNIETLLRERLYRKVTISENGRRKQIPAVDAVFATLVKSSLEGDSRALNQLLKLLPLAAADGPSGDETTVAPDMDATDEAILRDFFENGGAALLKQAEADEEDDT